MVPPEGAGEALSPPCGLVLDQRVGISSGS
jgi:hypothetical protein